MISQKLQDAINAQIVAEMWSANLYLSMSYFFAAKGYEGFAAWMKAQSREENEHADMLAQYVLKRGGVAKDKASQDFLWGFVREQVEEEATAQGIVDKIKLGGEAGLFYLDAQLGARK